MGGTANRWKRYVDWDERPLSLDKSAAEDAANSFSDFSSPADPKPEISINDGRSLMLDGVLEHDFDMIDHFIALHLGISSWCRKPWHLIRCLSPACWSTRICPAAIQCSRALHDASEAG